MSTHPRVWFPSRKTLGSSGQVRRSGRLLSLSLSFMSLRIVRVYCPRSGKVRPIRVWTDTYFWAQGVTPFPNVLRIVLGQMNAKNYGVFLHRPSESTLTAPGVLQYVVTPYMGAIGVKTCGRAAKAEPFLAETWIFHKVFQWSYSRFRRAKSRWPPANCAQTSVT